MKLLRVCDFFRLTDLDKIICYKQRDEVSYQNKQISFTCPDDKFYKDIKGGSVLQVRETFHEDYLASIVLRTKQDKGNKMYEERYLLSLRLAQINEFRFLKGRVRAELYKKVVYIVNVRISKENLIVGAECECKSKSGPTAYCKHIIVIFRAIQDFLQTQSIITSETCTQVLQSFHRPSKKYELSPVKARNICLPRGNRESRNGFMTEYDPRPVEFQKDKGYRSYFRNICINFASEFNQHFPGVQLFESANMRAIVHDHNYLAVDVEQQYLKVLGVMNISMDERDRIEQITIGQSNNKHWRYERSLRLNSSDFFKICTRQDPSFLIRTLFNTKDLSNVPAIRHVRFYEIFAIRELEKNLGIVTKECGTFVSDLHSYLAASPDRIICDEKLVEVKCPFSAFLKPITPSSVPYLFEDSNGILQLERHHPYFYQIQGQLYCSDRNFCYFVVYTKVDIKVIEIERDEKFIDEMLI